MKNVFIALIFGLIIGFIFGVCATLIYIDEPKEQTNYNHTLEGSIEDRSIYQYSYR